MTQPSPGPPGGLPDVVPDFVGDLLGSIGDWLGDMAGNLGEIVSGIAGGGMGVVAVPTVDWAPVVQTGVAAVLLWTGVGLYRMREPGWPRPKYVLHTLALPVMTLEAGVFVAWAAGLFPTTSAAYIVTAATAFAVIGLLSSFYYNTTEASPA